MGLLAGEEGLLSLLSMTFRKFDIVRALFYLYCFWESKHQGIHMILRVRCGLGWHKHTYIHQGNMIPLLL